MHVRHPHRPAALKQSNNAGMAANPRMWENMPHINQLSPEGAGRAYDGSKDCAPAVVAMLARAAGTGGNLSDAQLIKELGQGLVGPDGTEPKDMPAMLERAGLPVAGKALAGRYSDQDVAQHLNQGHALIAQVEARDERGTTSSHYVTVQGMTPQGNYVVSDPLADGPYELSPQELRSQVRGAPPDGGMLIPVGASPASAQAASSAGVAGLPGSCDSFEAAPARAASSAVNNGALDIKYGDRGPLKARGKNADVAPERLKAGQYSQRLMQMKENNPEKAEQLLGRLEVSRDRKDQAVLRRVENADSKQPGIGKKTTVEGYSE
jgi:hypothetical protein